MPEDALLGGRAPGRPAPAVKALSGGAATKIVPLSSTYPFVTFALAVLFLGESVTLNRVLGTFLLSGGIYFISK